MNLCAILMLRTFQVTVLSALDPVLVLRGKSDASLVNNLWAWLTHGSSLSGCYELLPTFSLTSALSPHPLRWPVPHSSSLWRLSSHFTPVDPAKPSLVAVPILTSLPQSYSCMVCVFLVINVGTEACVAICYITIPLLIGPLALALWPRCAEAVTWVKQPSIQ